MDCARAVLQQEIGTDKERELFRVHGNDVDAYINAACAHADDGMQCPSCKATTARIEMLQTRSADEGMTAFIVCTSCQYRATFR